MESCGEYNRAAGLATAFVGSLAFHIILVTLLVFCGRSEPETEETEPADRPPAAVVPPSEPAPDAPAVSEPDPPAPARRAAGPTRVAPPAPPPAAAETAGSTEGAKEYVVKKGDNLTMIARRAGCSLEELAQLNNTTVKKLSNLWVGQKIKVK